MDKIKAISFFIIGFFLLSANFVMAVEVLKDGKTIIPVRTSEVIKIDGDLSEKVWGSVPISEEFMTHYPLYGEPMGQKTDAWMAYSSGYLYFAFKCYDTEPNRVKTSITQRDKISRDDWIGVGIDAMGNKQTSIQFYVNPNGIQADEIFSAVSGWDMAPDFVWESAGKLTDDGYQVEIAIPLESIRFKSGKEVKMGIIFLRRISRFGTMSSWPEQEAGQTQLNFMATAICKDLKKRLNLEVLPNFTYSRAAERENPDSWGKDNITNLGVGLKYGITSSITAEATVNPDFSQVESDAFQVEVNQRYPIFYSEKRPFFMEGTDVFDFGLISEGMMLSAVHTRNIADPGWASKLSGSTGKMAFALLTANDKFPGQPLSGGAVNPNEGKKAFWGIARARYSLGSDNSLGILYSGRHFAGSHNDVVGADFQYRFFKNARITLSYLYSRTEEPGENEVKNGNGFNAMLQYSIPQLDAWAAYERYDDDFTMYSAFLKRKNIGRGLIYIGPNFYMKKIPWLQKIQPYFQYIQLHDMGTKMDDKTSVFGVRANFYRHAYVKIEYRDLTEEWVGQLFNYNYLYLSGGIQLSKWVFIESAFRYGDQIYYHPAEPFLGHGRFAVLGLIFQPNANLNLDFNFYHNTLYRKPENQKFYSVNIYNILATYQFNKYFFIRAAVRYNDYQKKLLTDLLASFTLIPGTVMHLGYGSIYENKAWANNQWVTGDGSLLNMKNSLFFKVSYLWRIK